MAKTKREKDQEAEIAAAEQRQNRLDAEQDRLTHLVDPLTHPSSGDPPPAISPAGDRLGTVPVTRNAVADQEQAKAEGLEAAEQHEPTKAERESAQPKAEQATEKTQTPSHDGAPMTPVEHHAIKENEATRNAIDPKR